MLFAILFLVNLAFGDLVLNYCATRNLGTGDAVFNDFMSNGLCRDNCNLQGFAVAVLQGNNCWCSNNVPGNTVDMSNCDTGCPGTANEKCAQNGYYGYYVFGEPSSTVGAPRRTSPTTTTAEEENTNTPVVVLTSVIASTRVIRTTQIIDQSRTTVITKSELWSIGPTTVVSIKTVAGLEWKVTETQYITQLISESTDSSESDNSNPQLSNSILPAPSSSEGVDDAPVNKSSFWDDKGKVAGTFTAVAIVIVAIISGLLWFCCIAGGFAARKNNEDSDRYSDEEASINSFADEKQKALAAAFAAGGSTLRVSSSNSSGDTPMVIPPAYSNQRINNETANNSPIKRNSSSKSMFNLFSSENGGGVDRSSSKKKADDGIMLNTDIEKGSMFPITEFDNRLNPSTLFLNQNVSAKSLNDNQDYSRALRVANP